MSATNLSDETQQRNVKDFLLLYNKLTEQCFQNCVSIFFENKIEHFEASCLESCTDRYVAFNQRLMKVFMEHQKSRQEQTGGALSPITAGISPNQSQNEPTES
ncbi:Hypothetical predicted protein [Octopus vulgaris]|uniref:Uncharacterized protein n=2 Tax=Octopus TaxID=6643 RepID=A0AA36F3K8_OCTVU|nr:mitochondrial import inner membrane translocase subunit Tim9 isoform X1 [Octopus sinensis]CAI9723247.1 Hypothetical predicted protein [Octopus vulgaris]